MVDLSHYPKLVNLKGGQSVVLRVLTPADERELHRFLVELPPEERLHFRDDVSDPVTVHNWCQDLDFSRVIPLIALLGERIVADLTLHLLEHGWTRHMAEIRGVVRPDMRHCGLGTKMIYEMLSIAQSLELEKAMLELVKPQRGALVHFTSLGFGVEAVLKDWVKDFNGEYQDLLILSTRIEPAWRKMEEMVLDSDLGGE
jgi:GNAT superfamily N-acetyltransferase